MVSEYGLPFLYWLAQKTHDFYVFQWKWIDLLDDAEAHV